MKSHEYAVLCQAAVLPINEFIPIAESFGYEDVQFFSGDGPDVYCCFKQDEILAVFRSTQNKSVGFKEWVLDWITNLDYQIIETAWGGVHHGFYTAWRSLSVDVLEYMVTHKGPLTCIGWSQGGALAGIAFYELNATKCVTFGQPKFCDQQAKESILSGEGIEYLRYVYRGDFIPTIPWRNRYVHVVDAKQLGSRWRYSKKDHDIKHFIRG